MRKEHKTVQWRKSSRSGGEGGQCVELADLGGGIGIRDSKNPDAGHLGIPLDAFIHLVRRIKAHEFDL